MKSNDHPKMLKPNKIQKKKIDRQKESKEHQNINITAKATRSKEPPIYQALNDMLLFKNSTKIR